MSEIVAVVSPVAGGWPLFAGMNETRSSCCGDCSGGRGPPCSVRGGRSSPLLVGGTFTSKIWDGLLCAALAVSAAAVDAVVRASIWSIVPRLVSVGSSRVVYSDLALCRTPLLLVLNVVRECQHAVGQPHERSGRNGRELPPDHGILYRTPINGPPVPTVQCGPGDEPV